MHSPIHPFTGLSTNPSQGPGWIKNQIETIGSKIGSESVDRNNGSNSWIEKYMIQALPLHAKLCDPIVDPTF